MLQCMLNSRTALVIKAYYLTNRGVWHTAVSFSSKVVFTTEEKLTRQCRKLSWIMVGYWTSRCFNVVEGNNTNMRIHAFSSLVTESPWTSIKQSQTLTTHNANWHCHPRFTLLWENLCRNSCIGCLTFRGAISKYQKFVITSVCMVNVLRY